MSPRPESPSRPSSVRFNNGLEKRPSMGSLKSGSGLAISGLPNNAAPRPYQPVQPSSLHTSVVSSPSPTRTPPHLFIPHPALKPFPKAPASPPSLHSFNSGSTTTSEVAHHRVRRPSLQRVSSSQSRRVWSEVLPKHETFKLAHGQKASKVTGGFETSSEESSSEDGRGGNGTANGAGILNGHTGNGTSSQTDSNWVPEPRRRSKSLVVPSGRGAADLLPPTSVPPKRYFDQRPKRKTSRDMLRERSSSRASRNGGGSPSLNSHFSAGRSEGVAESSNGRANSFRSTNGGIYGPHRQMSSSSRTNGVERVRHEGGRTSSPDGSSRGDGKDMGQDVLEDGFSPKSKHESRSDLFAESLGLGGSHAKDLALNTDQIHSLFGDTDLATAIRIMNSGQLASPRPSLANAIKNPTITHKAATEEYPHASPFLVSAPPPLIQDHGINGRDRSVSIASTIATTPHMRSTWSPHQVAFDPSDVSRRRSNSRSSVAEPMGGHTPFTHHVQAMPQMEEEPSDNENGLTLPQQGPSELEAVTPALSDEGSMGQKGKDKKKSKKGLGSFFSVGRRRSGEAATPAPVERKLSESHHVNLHRSDTQRAAEHARDKEAKEREIEMRRIELEKRQEEIMQERRYRALTQVAAHPNSERLAYKAGAHLRAYYHHVYDCVDNPPRLNFTKMLRWLSETDKQNAARSQYHESLQREQHEDEGTVVRGSVHSSKVNLAGSVGSSRSPSHSSKRKSNEVSPHKKTKPRRWNYTVEDIQVFRESGGVVNYFVPPRQMRPSVDILPEEGLPSFSKGHGFGRDSSKDYDFGPQSPQSQDRHGDENSSMAESSKKGYSQEMRFKSATASYQSLAEVDESLEPESLKHISRSTSMDTGGDRSLSGRRDGRISHRSHQSLSAVGNNSLTHALKQPFEKLSNAARKQRTMPYLHMSSDRDSHQPDDFERSTDHPDIGMPQVPVSQRAAGHTSRDSFGSAGNKSSWGQSQKGTPSRGRETGSSLFRRHGPVSQDSLDEEEGGKRRLFIKGHHRRGVLDEVRKRQERGGGESVEARNEALKEAEMVYAKEQQFKALQLQAEEEEKVRMTRDEEAALLKIMDLENEIYEERKVLLRQAKDRLNTANHDIDIVDESIRQYLDQVDLLQDEAKISNDIFIDFSLADPIKARYQKKKSKEFMEDQGEHRDTLPPLRSFGSAESTSEGGSRISVTRRNRSQNGGPQSSSVTAAPKKKNSLASSLHLQPLRAVQPRARPRRTYLAPNGFDRVDPVTQAKLMIEFGQDRQSAMSKERQELADELSMMIEQVEGMIEQKDEVRYWVSEALERASTARTQLDRLRAREHSSLDLTQLSSQRDILVDKGLRILGALFRLGYALFQYAKLPCRVLALILRPAFFILGIVWSIIWLPWALFKKTRRGPPQRATIVDSSNVDIVVKEERTGFSDVVYTTTVLACGAALFFWYYGTDS
ncbi:hypothetical protein L202_04080 [Cryptococcus amylolentus CBS 6039]|uniref:Uncharacterized protein n=1 Tax=Cryptococcus amylolentus CBS 6039 TaxID=1295533 RepID=A0A1E3HQ39_9TREE|nr:hypothetical protein L202_04080 [Cryptococcus amylolentus CBS 6039]ODN78444.1 hypothetical protein L202_04080 [Cryptococcus amylolentus CBS 6039]